MYYLRRFVAHLFLLLKNPLGFTTLPVSVCVWECVFSLESCPVNQTQPRLLTSLLSWDSFSAGRWWRWWEGMLSLTSAGLPCHLYLFQVQPETDRFYLTSHLNAAALCLRHSDMHVHIYKYACIYIDIYVHTVHKWVANMNPLSVLLHRQCTACLLHGQWNNCKQLTWQPFSLFHFFHTPRGTNCHFGFCFYLGTWNDNEGRGEFVTLQCADWTQRKLSEDNDSWKLGLQWKPFWPGWVRPTDSCGWWLGGK